MSEPSKCCGKCRWWKTIAGETRNGRCLHHLPSEIRPHHHVMRACDGTDCQCFSPPIPQEVIEAVRRYRNDCEWVADPFTIADYFIQQNPQLKGN